MDFILKAFFKCLDTYRFAPHHVIHNADGSYLLVFTNLPPNLDIRICNATIEEPLSEEERESFKKMNRKYGIDKNIYQPKKIRIATSIEGEKTSNKHTRSIKILLDKNNYAKKINKIDFILRTYLERNFK